MSVQEQVLLDLARWLARARQYSAGHPSCAALADETHKSLARALVHGTPVEYAITRDDAFVGGVPAVHPTVRTRMAPFLYARGARLVRFAPGISRAELATFVDLLLPLPHKIAEAGGLAQIARERGVSRVEVEEVDGALADDERQEGRDREELKRFFADSSRAIIAQLPIDVDVGKLGELLERADVAASIVEDESRGGVAEGAAALAQLAQNHGSRRRREPSDAMGDVLRALSPESKSRVLLGFPALAFELRGALMWALGALTEDQLASFAFPAIRAEATEPTAVLYALSLVVPRPRARLAIVRRMALHLYDVPDDEAPRVLGDLGAPAPDFDSFRAERELLGDAARRALVTRRPLFALRGGATASPVTKGEPDYGRVMTDLVTASAAVPGFPELCERLPAAARAIEEQGGAAATLGLLRGLGAVGGPSEPYAVRALEAIAQGESGARLLPALDVAVANADERALAELGALAQCLVRQNAEAACTLMEETENRKLRLLLSNALPAVGPAVVPLVRPRLKSTKWEVVRSFVQLAARVGATPRDLMPIARHADERIRAEILRALRTMPADEVTLDIVIGYLNDPSLEVRPLARAMLDGTDLVVGSAAVPRLERIAKDEKQDDNLRHAALGALGQGTIDEAAEALFRFMQPGKLIESNAVTAMRDVAAAALYASPSEAGKRLFAEGLASSVRRVRRSCERAEGGS